ncbi:neurogenic locus Notch protein [Nematostella vectensis]|uniref:neurogenic locus Notch protein n=1 Tax=Nematostella vectensis TaxID=45351 RepID=UPI0020774290|nr:neurogenic locus Notch protein [Nematostella vectensis]
MHFSRLFKCLAVFSVITLVVSVKRHFKRSPSLKFFEKRFLDKTGKQGEENVMLRRLRRKSSETKLLETVHENLGDSIELFTNQEQLLHSYTQGLNGDKHVLEKNDQDVQKEENNSQYADDFENEMESTKTQQKQVETRPQNRVAATGVSSQGPDYKNAKFADDYEKEMENAKRKQVKDGESQDRDTGDVAGVDLSTRTEQKNAKYEDGYEKEIENAQTNENQQSNSNYKGSSDGNKVKYAEEFEREVGSEIMHAKPINQNKKSNNDKATTENVLEKQEINEKLRNDKKFADDFEKEMESSSQGKHQQNKKQNIITNTWSQGPGNDSVTSSESMNNVKAAANTLQVKPLTNIGYQDQTQNVMSKEDGSQTYSNTSAKISPTEIKVGQVEAVNSNQGQGQAKLGSDQMDSTSKNISLYGNQTKPGHVTGVATFYKVGEPIYFNQNNHVTNATADDTATPAYTDRVNSPSPFNSNVTATQGMSSQPVNQTNHVTLNVPSAVEQQQPLSMADNVTTTAIKVPSLNETSLKPFSASNSKETTVEAIALNSKGEGAMADDGHKNASKCADSEGSTEDCKVEPLPVQGVLFNPCLNGGKICASPYTSMACCCPAGFKGEKCEELMYCRNDSNPCMNNGSCIETDYGFRCICKEGYAGIVCDAVTYCKPNPCKHDASCVEQPSGFHCLCPHGYQGTKCEDVDPCATNPCFNGGICTEVKGKANCTCLSKYKGPYCQDELICFQNPCQNGGRCVENKLLPCVCAQGYNGRYCTEHVCSSNPCENGGQCKVIRAKTGGDGFWGYKCACSIYYTGKHCEIPHYCVKNPCKNGATCIDPYGQTNNSKRWVVHAHAYPYICQCVPGFTGKQCETDICSLCGTHAQCVNHRCVCAAGFVGDGYECKTVKQPCSPNPCHNNGTCEIGPDMTYDCVCSKGYCGRHCDEPCDQCKIHPCKNGGKCYLRASGERYCVCAPPYTGNDCSVKKENLCEPNPCLHKAVCQYSEDKHDYTCVCPGHFTGKHCGQCNCPKAQPLPDKKTWDAVCDAVGDCRCPDVEGSQLTLTEKGCVVGASNQKCPYNTCLNGGTCVIERGAEVCYCKSPYYGDKCQYLFCKEARPCKNGGTCVDTGPKLYACRCAPGYTGKNCTEPSPIVEPHCLPHPCKNGGRCIERQYGYDCQCDVRYTGPHCEVDRCADCDANAECCDGHCTCRYGYVGTGYICERDNDVPLTCTPPCPVSHECIQGQCVCLPEAVC